MSDPVYRMDLVKRTCRRNAACALIGETLTPAVSFDPGNGRTPDTTCLRRRGPSRPNPLPTRLGDRESVTFSLTADKPGTPNHGIRFGDDINDWRTPIPVYGYGISPHSQWEQVIVRTESDEAEALPKAEIAEARGFPRP